MHRPSPRLGAAFGLMSGISFLALYCLAVAIDPDYVFFEDYLSDLGVGPGAWAFNSAVIVSGTLLLLFAKYGLGQLLPKGGFTGIATLVLSVAGLFLIGVGVITEDYGDKHTVVSIGFFIALEVAIGLVSAALFRSNALGRTGWAFSSAVFVLCFGVGLFGANPATETVAVLVAVSWGLSLSSLTLWLETGHSVP